jgi:hypothetical protein
VTRLDTTGIQAGVVQTAGIQAGVVQIAGILPAGIHLAEIQTGMPCAAVSRVAGRAAVAVVGRMATGAAQMARADPAPFQVQPKLACAAGNTPFLPRHRARPSHRTGNAVESEGARHNHGTGNAAESEGARPSHGTGNAAESEGARPSHGTGNAVESERARPSHGTGNAVESERARPSHGTGNAVESERAQHNHGTGNAVESERARPGHYTGIVAESERAPPSHRTGNAVLATGMKSSTARQKKARKGAPSEPLTQQLGPPPQHLLPCGLPLQTILLLPPEKQVVPLLPCFVPTLNS